MNALLLKFRHEFSSSDKIKLIENRTHTIDLSCWSNQQTFDRGLYYPEQDDRSLKESFRRHLYELI